MHQIFDVEIFEPEIIKYTIRNISEIEIWFWLEIISKVLRRNSIILYYQLTIVYLAIKIISSCKISCLTTVGICKKSKLSLKFVTFSCALFKVEEKGICQVDICMFLGINKFERENATKEFLFANTQMNKTMKRRNL